MFIYESHMGGFFASEEELSYEECSCEVCGDRDWLVGKAETKEEARDLIEGSCVDYGQEEVDEFLKEYFSEQGESEVNCVYLNY